jgi:hypothetical protein
MFRDPFGFSRITDNADVPSFTGNEGKALFVNIMGTMVEYADPEVGVSTSVQGGSSTTLFEQVQNVQSGNATAVGSSQYSGGSA